VSGRVSSLSELLGGVATGTMATKVLGTVVKMILKSDKKESKE
jgi:hypothetical protein